MSNSLCDEPLEQDLLTAMRGMFAILCTGESIIEGSSKGEPLHTISKVLSDAENGKLLGELAQVVGGTDMKKAHRGRPARSYALKFLVRHMAVLILKSCPDATHTEVIRKVSNALGQIDDKKQFFLSKRAVEILLTPWLSEFKKNPQAAMDSWF